MKGEEMEKAYDENSRILKALGDSSRLKIMDILSCGERCACEILEHFDFTQPTLSHHMKILMDCGLVTSKKVGTWTHYSLNQTQANRLILFLMGVITSTDDCICKDSSNKNKEKGICNEKNDNI